LTSSPLVEFFPLVIIVFWFCFCFCTRGLTISRQALYPLSHSTSPVFNLCLEIISNFPFKHLLD
jgi:hypothetical protein